MFARDKVLFYNNFSESYQSIVNIQKKIIINDERVKKSILWLGKRINISCQWFWGVQCAFFSLKNLKKTIVACEVIISYNIWWYRKY